MTHEPSRKSPPTLRAPTTPEAASVAHEQQQHERGDEALSSDRPTVNPPFDVEAFARAATASPCPPSERPAAERNHPSDSPTAPPPSPAPSDDLPTGTEDRTPRTTPTDGVALRKAIAPSMTSERPDPSTRRLQIPRTSSSSALSFANARVSSSPEVPPMRPPSPSNIEAAVLGAIGSSAPEITERTIEDPIAEMHERFSLGDYTGALEVAELLLTEDPADPEAGECAASCRSVLENMYAARLGPLDRVPSVLVQRSQLRWLSIDHRAGFVLSLVDGTSTLEMILDVCGMPKLDGLRILSELVRQKIVALKS